MRNLLTRFFNIFYEKEIHNFKYKSTRHIYLALICWITGRIDIMEGTRWVYKSKCGIEVFIPVVLVLIVFNIPLTFMELGIAQFSKRGWIQMWDMCPVWRGIAISGVFILFVCSLQNNLAASYFLFYSIETFRSDSPWLKCHPNQTFNKKGCFAFGENRTIYMRCLELKGIEHCKNLVWKSSLHYFWEENIGIFTRKAVTNFDSMASYNSKISVYKCVNIFLIFVVIRKSVITFQTFTPFLVFAQTILYLILIVSSFLHPGSLRGVESESQFQSCYSIDSLMTFSQLNLCALGFSYGGIPTFANQNSFRSPINMQAIAVCICNFLFAYSYGVLFYNIVGILSYELNMPLYDVFDISDDYCFVQFPLSFKYWKWKTLCNFWTFIYFFSCYLLIFRNLAAQCVTLLTVTCETFPALLSYIRVCSFFICVVLCLLNFITAWDLVRIFLERIVALSEFIVLPLIVSYETFAIAIFYGLRKFVDDMHFMLGFRPANLWRLSYYINHIFYFTLFVWSIIKHEKETPSHAEIKIYLIELPIVVFVAIFPLLYFTVYVVRARVKTKKPFLQMIRPINNYGPREDILRKSRDMFSAYAMTKEYLYRQQRLKRFKAATRRDKLQKPSSDDYPVNRN